MSETGEDPAPARLFRPRSLLFVPGDRADRIAKAAAGPADAVAVDLEDAVAPGAKIDARRTALAAITALATSGHRRGPVVLLRVNPVDSPWHADDLAAAADAGADGVVLPKAEHPDQVAAVAAVLAERGGGPGLVVAGIETARGVAGCRALLGGGGGAGPGDHPGGAGGPAAAYFGAEDYIADLGGRRTSSNLEVLHARSEVVLAARLAGVGAIDQAVVDVRDDDRFRVDAAEGQDLGYPGKICLHPRQVTLAHELYTPSAEDVDHARRVLAAGRDGVGVVDGAMVDGVHMRMAAATLRRAGLAGS